MENTISNFEFKLKGYGHYNVLYTCPWTGNEFEALINEMSLIDDTKNECEPTQEALDRLADVCITYLD